MIFWLIVIVSLLAGIVSAVTAPKLGRSPVEAFFLGIFLWPGALVMSIVAVIKR